MATAFFCHGPLLSEIRFYTAYMGTFMDGVIPYECDSWFGSSLFLFSIASYLSAMDSFAANNVQVYHEACDGSAAVLLRDAEFVVASDEDNVLRTYKIGESGKTGMQTLQSDFLQIEDSNEEVDIEGATRIGDRIYWIGSHARSKQKDNKNSKEKKKERQRLFATDIQFVNNGVHFKPVHKPYTKLLDDIKDVEIDGKKLSDSISIAPNLPGGLNIEGLAATPEGALMVAFRNPIINGRAIIAQIDNPRQLVEENHARAVVSHVYQLDLAGLGIRSVDYSVARGAYLIIAGGYEDLAEHSMFRIFEWEGPSKKAKQLRDHILDNASFQPEAVFTFPNKPDEIYILSDDGEYREQSSSTCKEADEKTFRGVMVQLPTKQREASENSDPSRR